MVLPDDLASPPPIETDPLTGGPAPYDPDGGGLGTHPCLEVGAEMHNLAKPSCASHDYLVHLPDARSSYR